MKLTVSKIRNNVINEIIIFTDVEQAETFFLAEINNRNLIDEVVLSDDAKNFLIDDGYYEFSNGDCICLIWAEER